MNPLLLAPAHEADLLQVKKLVADARAALDRGYSAAVAALPWPAPANELPHSHQAYMAFRREADPVYGEIYRLSLDRIRAENWAMIEPDSAERADLIHRLAGVGFSGWPPVAKWYAEVKLRKASGPLFQPTEVE